MESGVSNVVTRGGSQTQGHEGLGVPVLLLLLLLLQGPGYNRSLREKNTLFRVPGLLAVGKAGERLCHFSS